MPNKNQPIEDFKTKFCSDPDSPATQYLKVFEDNHDDLEDFQNHIIILNTLAAAIAKLTINHYYNPNTILKP